MQSKSGVKRMTMNKGSDKTFTELHETYIKKCKVNNLSEYTINFYKVSVRMFGKFVDIDQLKANEIDRELIDDYILHLKETGVKDVTINERTQTGKAIAKTKAGFKEGRPKEYTETQINMALDLLGKHSYTQVAEMTKISKATLTREMRKRKASLAVAI